MGSSISHSKGSEAPGSEELSRIFSLPDGVWLLCSDRFSDDALVDYCFLDAKQRNMASQGLSSASEECKRAVACLLGLAVGDALGAPLEFHPVRYVGGSEFTKYSPPAGMDPSLWADTSEMRETNRFLLKMGQWTDDTSMALCLADSLLTHNGFHPQDLRLRFLAWLKAGYNNAFRLDSSRSQTWGSRASIGLGGTIGESLKEFTRVAADYTSTGTYRSSGNGSIMRNAPISIMYRNNLDAAMDAAWKQSKTTHLGDEAADCARLLTYVCIRAIKEGSAKRVLASLYEFPAKLYSTKCLAESCMEERCRENEGEKLECRDWRWRSNTYRYAADRVSENPGYVGSYAMDCLAMALHSVWKTSSFEEAVLHAANTCGDADTVAAVTGQIAGSLYGISSIPQAWREAVEQWDEGDIACRAWLLFAADSPAVPNAMEKPGTASWSIRQDVEKETASDDGPKSLPPFVCTCGKRFANPTILKMHAKKQMCP